jgi:SAM-dependent methyltransferase
MGEDEQARTRRERMRASFNEVASLYEHARPDYPPELFTDLATLTGVGPGSRVLEIGCGTGQATRPLAELGCDVTCVELGPDLAAAATSNLASFANVRIVVAAFEDWPPPSGPGFDLVLAATSFHWLDPATRLGKIAEALRPGGFLATIATEHVAGGDVGFFAEVQSCYERWDPETPPDLRLLAAAEIPTDTADLDACEWFDQVSVRRYERDLEYTAEAYRDLLMTYSSTLALDATGRDGLLGCITNLINDQYAGRIRKRYLSELRLARRDPRR